MRTGLVVMLALHAIACGRIGFDTGSDIGDCGTDGSVPPGQIAVRVMGAPDDPDAGQPIENATVVFVGATATRTYVTDANGYVIGEADGSTTIHVGYQTTILEKVPHDEWRLYTLVDIAGGSEVSLGFVPPAAFAVIEVDVAAVASATRYGLRGPKRCGIDGSTDASPVRTTVNGCNGESLPIFAVAFDTDTPLQWLAAGVLAADDGARYTASGNWQAIASETIRFVNTPSNLLITGELVHELGPRDRLVLDESDFAPVLGDHDETLPVIALPVDSIRALFTSSTAPMSFGLVAEPAPPVLNGARTFDGSRLVRIAEMLTLEADGAVSWTYAPFGRDPTLVITQVAYDTVDGVPAQWILSGPLMTRAAIPRLAAPLDAIAPEPSTMDATVVGLIMGDATYSDIAPVLFDDLALVTSLADLPEGWAMTALFLSTTTVRERQPSRLEALARRVTSAAE